MIDSEFNTIRAALLAHITTGAERDVVTIVVHSQPNATAQSYTVERLRDFLLSYEREAPLKVENVSRRLRSIAEYLDGVSHYECDG